MDGNEQFGFLGNSRKVPGIQSRSPHGVDKVAFRDHWRYQRYFFFCWCAPTPSLQDDKKERFDARPQVVVICDLRHICFHRYARFTGRGLYQNVHQRVIYSGKDKFHALKFQALTTPCGSTAHMSGPYAPRRHDSRVLTMSHLHRDFQRLQHGWPRKYKIYGDKAYKELPLLIPKPRLRLQQRTWIQRGN